MRRAMAPAETSLMSAWSRIHNERHHRAIPDQRNGVGRLLYQGAGSDSQGADVARGPPTLGARARHGEVTLEKTAPRATLFVAQHESPNLT